MPETPVVETPVNQPEDVKSAANPENSGKQTEKASENKSPANDLREIQQLLVMGIFPGQMAPAVVKAFHLLEAMAKGVEAEKGFGEGRMGA